jgi:hypothetical protein
MLFAAEGTNQVRGNILKCYDQRDQCPRDERFLSIASTSLMACDPAVQTMYHLVRLGFSVRSCTVSLAKTRQKLPVFQPCNAYSRKEFSRSLARLLELSQRMFIEQITSLKSLYGICRISSQCCSYSGSVLMRLRTCCYLAACR